MLGAIPGSVLTQGLWFVSSQCELEGAKWSRELIVYFNYDMLQCLNKVTESLFVICPCYSQLIIIIESIGFMAFGNF